jgi:hypothetical protein
MHCHCSCQLEEDYMSIDLRKQTVKVVLEKKKLVGVKARVALVLDISGSMRKLYNEGIVQDAVERVLAVASQFDDDGMLDIWVYDNTFSRLPAVSEKELPGYVERAILQNDAVHKFGRNDEPLVMKDVVNKYLNEEPSKEPAFIIFINDGGCRSGIKKWIVSTSNKPLFWQFVGIGNSNFDVLRKLDTMEGRLVDNANFFHLEALEHTSDEDLYSSLLDEFPSWLEQAKAQGVL